MSFQVLLSTMNRKDISILTRMHVTSNAIVINQNNFVDYKHIKQHGKKILFITVPESGVGLSRNMSLSRANADICLLADDDVVYNNQYEQKILDAFKDHPEADVLIFNLTSTNPLRPTATVKKATRIRRYNSLRYGTFQLAFRLEKIRVANIHFSLLFGGGARYSSGEDSIFIYDCLRKGLKIYALPVEIGIVNHEESTWFRGYNDKYFKDKGALYGALSPRFAYLLVIQYILRKYKTFNTEKSMLQILSLMSKGVREIRNR